MAPTGPLPTDGDGTYSLLVAVPEALAIDVGALGQCTCPAGGYAYTGSAMGSGGFARLDRHRRVAAGDNEARHWHVDSLLGHPDTALVAVERVVGADVECRVARALPDGPVDGFGASDCDCRSHLAARGTVGGMAASLRRVYADCGVPERAWTADGWLGGED